MSRSALWRQEGNVKERERRAEEIFQQACQEGRTRSKSTLSLWGPDNDTFHFNPLLLHNTIRSQYFQKCCTNCIDWTSIIDEIYYEVKHLQVFQLAKQPSSGFCLLLRLLCFRMTSHELDQTIRHVDSPYIRAIGFLFIRYGGCPPEQIWDWIEPFIHDEEEFSVEQQGKHVSNLISIGDFVRKLFQERDYYNTTPLPRFPVNIERDLHVKLLSADKIDDRAKKHYNNPHRMKQFQVVGAEIQALYGDDENPPKWYDAVIDRIVQRSDDGTRTLKYPKFVVTFQDYGNTETVLLGEIDVRGSAPDSHHINSHPYNKSGHTHCDEGRVGGYCRPPYGKSGNGNHRDAKRRNDEEHDLYEEVRKAERAKVTSSDKFNWARRPPSTKANLAQKNTQNVHDKIPPFSATSRQHQSSLSASLVATDTSQTIEEKRVSHPSKKRTTEEMAAIEEKKRKLLSKYG